MFKNRLEAGVKLSQKIASLTFPISLVLAIPRGGVPIGYEIAKKLEVPLSVIIARKIGNPKSPELGIGALSEENVVILDHNLINQLGITKNKVDEVVKKEKEEMARRIKLYRNDQNLPSLKNKDILLVDDGVARGVTALAAIKAIKKLQPKSLIFATPVIGSDTTKEIGKHVDNLVFLISPKDFQAIGEYYEDFAPVEDEEVISLINETLL